MKFLNPLKKGFETVDEGANILKEKVTSSVEEEKIEQAKNRILVKAAAIREIMEALNCSSEDACKLLEEELNK